MSANEWMRQHSIDVLDYLPRFLGKDPMFKKTADTCSTEHNRLRLALQDLADNFFVNTATWRCRSMNRSLVSSLVTGIPTNSADSGFCSSCSMWMCPRWIS